MTSDLPRARTAVVFALLAACGPSSPPWSHHASPDQASVLPPDAVLGRLGIAPTTADDDPWIPRGTRPFLVGDAPPRASWLAVDTAGHAGSLALGDAVRVPYGCDDNALTASALEGAGPWRPGLVWLRPTGAGPARPLPIVDDHSRDPARRGYRVGDGEVQLVRVAPTRGVATIRWKAATYTLPFEPGEMAGADRAVDLSQPGVAQPVPEAAWELGEGTALIVLRIPSYEGLGFKAIVLGGATAREVEPMALYLYRCAF